MLLHLIEDGDPDVAKAIAKLKIEFSGVTLSLRQVELVDCLV